jgi:hypothetical protein
MTWAVPTITGIQRTTALITLAASALVGALISPHAAIGCLTGGIVMIANLYLLALVGKAVVALAQAGGVVKFGAMIAPLKILALAGVVYWLVIVLRIDVVGFSIGVLTQFIAVFVETGRVSLLLTHSPTEDLRA